LDRRLVGARGHGGRGAGTEPAVRRAVPVGQGGRDQRARRPGDEADARPRGRAPGAAAAARPPAELGGDSPRARGLSPIVRAPQYDSARVDGKRYLITPGPTPVPPEVVAAESAPLHHHRSPDFRALLGETIERLKRIFETEHDVLLFTGSGTAAMESAIANLLSPGDRAVVASAGNFGERWLRLARPDRIAAAAGEGETVAVYVTQSETSTGVVHDIEAIARAVAATGALVVVDAVSSLGGVELATDSWGVDVAVAGSQKALMCPPGLAFAS